MRSEETLFGALWKCRGSFVNYLRPFSPEIEGRKSAKMFANILPRFSPISCKYFTRTSLWGIAGTKECGFWSIFSPTFGPKNPLPPLLNPFQAIDKTHLKPTLSGNNLFSKKGPEAALIQHNATLLNTLFLNISCALGLQFKPQLRYHWQRSCCQISSQSAQSVTAIVYEFGWNCEDCTCSQLRD